MSKTAVSKTQEEYEDDFEKDLDWLIGEEDKVEEQDLDDEDFEAQIDKELEEDEERTRRKDKLKARDAQEEGEEERWPTPLEPVEGGFEPDAEVHYKASVDSQEELDEEKRYILEKIQQANQQLRNQEPPNQSRRRRLQFKDTLVDLVVPAPEHSREAEQECGSAPLRDSEVEGEVSGKLQMLNISPRNDDSAETDRDTRGEEEEEEEEERQMGAGGEGRVLVEKDGKFDLVSLKEVESQGLLPPLPCSHGDIFQRSSPQHSSPSSKSPATSPRESTASVPPIRTELSYAPKPPAMPRHRPSSASHSLGQGGRQGTKRRIQSASSRPSHATYTLSPQQKEQLVKLQQRRERLAREEEQRKRDEEEQRRQENELAFRAWLVRKREQLQDERRVLRAQEMERLHFKKEDCDPDEAFKTWLQRKQEQQMKERQLEEMKRLEQESGFYLPNREESERAFKTWLRRKRTEKRAEQQAARERSRRLVLEERRARRMQDLLCTVNESRPFRFTDHHGYRF